jgi:ABC-type cobalamin/Fe3+-siderophores transport system ATPase subunit
MISINEISYARPNNPILTNFSATIEQNCATLLSGSNGAGKTTLINLIGGLLKPSAGSISINNHKLAQLSTKEQSKLRSIAPQHRTFDLAFTVDEVLAIIPAPHRSSHEADVWEALDLNKLANLKVTELSIGQQQRVNVALALIQEAPFYLLDEPFSAQDTSHTNAMLDLLIQLSKEQGLLVVAHNAESFQHRFSSTIRVS